MIIVDLEYHIVELHHLPTEVIEWCESQFGFQGSRWFTRSPKIYFTSKMDHMMFVLRWS
jgi:hypothetical protein